MKEEEKDKIITRAIHFIATNTKDDSYRIGQAIIAELGLVKKFNINKMKDSNGKELTDEDEGVESCMNCGKYFYQEGINDLCHHCHTLI